MLFVWQAAVTRVLPQEHSEPSPSPYDASALNNLNMAGSSSNQNRSLPSPSTLAHRNIFESGEPSTGARREPQCTRIAANRSDCSHNPKQRQSQPHTPTPTPTITIHRVCMLWRSLLTSSSASRRRPQRRAPPDPMIHTHQRTLNLIYITIL